MPKGMSDKQKKYIDNKIKIMTDLVTEGINNGTAPFMIPWKAGEHPQVPHNPITGNTYTGFNNLFLTMQNKTDPRWMTAKNAMDNYGGIKAGERGVPIQFWSKFKLINKKDENGKIIKDEDGKNEKVAIPLARPSCKIFTVFNGDQIEGIEPYKHDDSQSKPEWQRHEDAEKIIDNSSIKINHLNGDRAFYSPKKDEITLPERGQFETADAYYATVMHELGHGTGHKSRLNRDLSNPFGSEGYAKEELVAELSSWQVNRELQLGHDPSQHASYIKSWIKAISEDENLIVRSCTLANAAAEYNLNLLDHKEEINIQTNKTDNSLNTDMSVPMSDLVNKDDRFLSLGLFDKEVKEGGALYRLVSSEDNNVLLLSDDTSTIKGKSIYHFSKVSIIDKDNLTDEQFNNKLISITENSDSDGILIKEAGKEVSLVDLGNNKYSNANDMLQSLENKHFIRVPYDDRNDAKSKGAAWSKDAGSWFIPQDAVNKSSFSSWEGDMVYDSPERQFEQFITESGGVLNGLPKMDGERHRIPSTLGKAGNTDFAYQGFLDGVPAGWVKDWHGETKNWKAEGNNSLTNEEKQALEVSAKAKKVERDNKRDAGYIKAAETSKQYTDSLPSLSNSSYHDSKGITLNEKSGVKEDAKGNLVLPLSDVNGKQWTHTTIQSSGFKQMFKGGKLQGNFFVVGDKDLGKNPDSVLICEGYSTAASIENSINRPVVVATHADNLPNVAKAIHEKHPNTRIYIFADDDKLLVEKGQKNKGLDNAHKAADLVGGDVIVPFFENSKGSKDRTDFNDMQRISGKKMVRDHIDSQVKMIRLKKESANKTTVHRSNNKNISVER